MNAPVAIRARQEERCLEVDWGNGHISMYPYLFLRENCECAACKDEWTGERRNIGVIDGLDVRIEGMELVGNYAVRIRWSDGHDTGLYTWEHLLSLCRCTRCRPLRAAEGANTE